MIRVLKLTGQFLFYFLMDIILLIALLIVIVGALFVLNLGIKELTGVDVIRNVAKKKRAESKTVRSKGGVQNFWLWKDRTEYPSGDTVVSRTDSREKERSDG